MSTIISSLEILHNMDLYKNGTLVSANDNAGWNGAGGYRQQVHQWNWIRNDYQSKCALIWGADRGDFDLFQ